MHMYGFYSSLLVPKVMKGGAAKVLVFLYKKFHDMINNINMKTK